MNRFFLLENLKRVPKNEVSKAGECTNCKTQTVKIVLVEVVLLFSGAGKRWWLCCHHCTSFRCDVATILGVLSRMPEIQKVRTIQLVTYIKRFRVSGAIIVSDARLGLACRAVNGNARKKNRLLYNMVTRAVHCEGGSLPWRR